MDVIALLAWLIGMFWLLTGTVLWFFGKAAREGIVLTSHAIWPNRRDPERDRREKQTNEDIGAIGSAMMRRWPIPVGLIVFSVAVFLLSL